MQIVSSIQTANKQYDTGDRPILVLCNDFCEYVCKLALGGNGMKLMCEYLSASFLRIWGLPVPDFKFVKLSYDHVQQYNVPKHIVERTCFGSKYNRSCIELSFFNDAPDLKKQKAYKDNRDQLLKIALFDLWLANEDRNFNNANLLIDVAANYQFIPIDHGSIFNSCEFSGDISLLTENESLTDVKLFKSLFHNTDFTLEYITELKEYFYLCTHNCKKQVHEILNEIPPDWEQYLPDVEQKLNNEVFTTDWESRVFSALLENVDSLYQ